MYMVKLNSNKEKLHQDDTEGSFLSMMLRFVTCLEVYDPIVIISELAYQTNEICLAFIHQQHNNKF